MTESDPPIQLPPPQPSARASQLPAPAPKKGGCFWKILILACVLGAAGYAAYRYLPYFKKDAAEGEGEAAGGKPGAAGGKRGAGGAGGPRSTPVVVATAKRGDLPIYLDAPGTVIARNAVVVRARVDGQVMKVAYQEGQQVKEGDLLAIIDPRPFETQLTLAQGQLAKDQALLKNARLDLARYQEAGHAATQQQVDTAAAAVGQYEGAVKIDQGNIDNANLQLTYCRITAPLDGQIGLRLVDAGNIVHASDTTGLAMITQVEPITVVFSLAEDNLQTVLKANSGANKLPVEVWNRDRRVKLASGTLEAVDSQIDLVTLTAKFKAEFDNKDHALFPNQAVNVRLLVDTLRNAVLIPVAAVQHSPQASFVYVVKADSTVDMRTITPGPIEGDIASVEKNLSDGEVVVTEGVDKLEPGAQVTLPGAKPAQDGAKSDGTTGKGRGGKGRSGTRLEGGPADAAANPAPDAATTAPAAPAAGQETAPPAAPQDAVPGATSGDIPQGTTPNPAPVAAPGAAAEPAADATNAAPPKKPENGRRKK